MGNKPWKQYERDVLEQVGGTRIPVSGRHPGDPDGVIPALPEFYVEIRRREEARPLRWIREAWAKAHARGQKPLVVFKGPAPHLSPLVVLRYSDFVEVIKRGRPGPSVGPAPVGEGGAGDAGSRGPAG